MSNTDALLPEDLEPTCRGTLEGRGQIELAFARWEHPHPKGRVVLLHGYGEHGERYRHIAHWFHELGWSMSTLDQQGFGRSGGKRGDGKGIRAFVDDYADFLRFERRYDAQRVGAEPRMLDGMPLPPAPACRQIALGHSFGGLVAALTLLWHPDAMDGLILSSPAIPLRPLTGMEALGVRLMGWLAPHWAPRIPGDKTHVCSDPVFVQRYWDDPLCHQHISSAFIASMKEGALELLPYGSELDRPMLLMEAGDDAHVDPQGAENLWGAVRPGLLERHRLEGLKHELLHDRQRSQVLALIKTWLETWFDYDT